MAYVITRPCVDCLDGSCLDACPIDCIVQEKPDAGLGLPDQLFIHPDHCIDCGSCAMACPEEAIFPDCDVPAEHEEDIARNAVVAEKPDAFQVPRRKTLERREPTDE